MMLVGLAPLLADWVDYIVPLVFVLIYVINQALSALNKGGQAKPVRRVPAPPPQGAGPARPQPAANRPTAEQQLDEFLRQAQARRAGQAEAPRREPLVPPRQAPREPAPQRPAARSVPPAQPQGQPGRRPPPREPIVAETVSSTPVRGKGLSDLGERHLDTSRFDQRANRLGRVADSSYSMEAHVHQSLDHQLGRLPAGAETEMAAGAPTTDGLPQPQAASVAAGIALLLASSEGIRDAVVLSEVLRRPTERW